MKINWTRTFFEETTNSETHACWLKKNVETLILNNCPFVSKKIKRSIRCYNDLAILSDGWTRNADCVFAIIFKRNKRNLTD